MQLMSRDGQTVGSGLGVGVGVGLGVAVGVGVGGAKGLKSFAKGVKAVFPLNVRGAAEAREAQTEIMRTNMSVPESLELIMEAPNLPLTSFIDKRYWII